MFKCTMLPSTVSTRFPPSPSPSPYLSNLFTHDCIRYFLSQCICSSHVISSPNKPCRRDSESRKLTNRRRWVPRRKHRKGRCIHHTQPLDAINPRFQIPTCHRVVLPAHRTGARCVVAGRGALPDQLGDLSIRGDVGARERFGTQHDLLSPCVVSEDSTSLSESSHGYFLISRVQHPFRINDRTDRGVVRDDYNISARERVGECCGRRDIGKFGKCCIQCQSSD
jgi:hypothetical protein